MIHEESGKEYTSLMTSLFLVEKAIMFASCLQIIAFHGLVLLFRYVRMYHVSVSIMFWLYLVFHLFFVLSEDNKRFDGIFLLRKHFHGTKYNYSCHLMLLCSHNATNPIRDTYWVSKTLREEVIIGGFAF